MFPIEKIEQEFDRFMALLECTRVSDEVGSSPNFNNADYVNQLNKVVIELKVLNKDFFPNGGIIDSLSSIIIKPVNIAQTGCGQYVFELPEINREGKNDNFEEPLRRILKKANKQLKDTKKYYWGDNISYGFLIFAQVGITISPEITALLIQKLINKEFSSIDGVIICTPYHDLINPTTLKKNPNCLSVVRQDDENKINLCSYILNSWEEYYNSGGHNLTTETKA